MDPSAQTTPTTKKTTPIADAAKVSTMVGQKPG